MVRLVHRSVTRRRPLVVPWCQCSPAERGFVQDPSKSFEWFVHSRCMKPAKPYYLKLHHRLRKPVDRTA